ncbi:hypothetical protein R1flu_005020 [Riccia fluitans]|uniref:Uncharacterized protein n=1 Tax=Riccia fluitans TaxID=41844 RepID=A0ABD1YRY2_9MARC
MEQGPAELQWMSSSQWKSKQELWLRWNRHSSFWVMLLLIPVMESSLDSYWGRDNPSEMEIEIEIPLVSSDHKADKDLAFEGIATSILHRRKSTQMLGLGWEVSMMFASS